MGDVIQFGTGATLAKGKKEDKDGGVAVEDLPSKMYLFQCSTCGCQDFQLMCTIEKDELYSLCLDCAKIVRISAVKTEGEEHVEEP